VIILEAKQVVLVWIYTPFLTAKIIFSMAKQVVLILLLLLQKRWRIILSG